MIWRNHDTKTLWNTALLQINTKYHDFHVPNPKPRKNIHAKGDGGKDGEWQGDNLELFTAANQQQASQPHLEKKG